MISAKGITKIYRPGNDVKVNALRDIDLDVERGEFMGISGPSGSGKTTLLNIIGGLDKPSSGFITVLGNRLDEMSDRELSRMRLNEVGYIFQEHNLLPSLTIRENLELPLNLARTPREGREERIKKLLKTVHLEDLIDRLPGELSRGQRQRIAALRALVNEPSIVLADEPTSDLDKPNALILLNFLKEMNQSNSTTIIMATTDPESLEGFVTRQRYLVDGELKDSIT